VKPTVAKEQVVLAVIGAGDLGAAERVVDGEGGPVVEGRARLCGGSSTCDGRDASDDSEVKRRQGRRGRECSVGDGDA
jgi:hypothetical protein